MPINPDSIGNIEVLKIVMFSVHPLFACIQGNLKHFIVSTVIGIIQEIIGLIILFVSCSVP